MIFNVFWYIFESFCLLYLTGFSRQSSVILSGFSQSCLDRMVNVGTSTELLQTDYSYNLLPFNYFIHRNASVTF